MSRRPRLLRASALALMLTTAPATADQVAPMQPADDKVCLQHIRVEERQHRIPNGLLAAIGLTESGRSMGRGHRTVWPWTVNAAGEGHYFESKADAIAFVEGKLADGIESIDVGCMQINLKHHPDAFASLEDAFDPAVNVGYGAEFLAALHDAFGGWITAARRYHSATPEKGEAYGTRVLANWTGPAKEREIAALKTAPDAAQTATAEGFLRALPVRRSTGNALSLFAQFYSPAALTQVQPARTAAATQLATAQAQEPGQAAADGVRARVVSTQKIFRRRVVPGQTGLTLRDYRGD
ncbi:MAG: lytic transglycosylase domain-containing protein [Dongiaceae bacterium]